MFIYSYNLYLNYIDLIFDCSVSDKKICQSINSESQKIQNIKSKQFCDNSKNKKWISNSTIRELKLIFVILYSNN